MELEKISEQVKLASKLISTSRSIVAFTGAGISTDSGIPDFRSHSSGMWQHVDPMAVASIYGFKKNPQAFFDWVRPLASLTLSAQPNSAHMALKNLEDMGYLKTVITQNIDMLHTKAGNQNIIELHGHLRLATCVHCFTVYEGEPLLKKFLNDGLVPHCPKCNGVIKPNVILFGEQLPLQELYAAQEAARKCDLMIIVGSSLEVAPASDIPVLAHQCGAKLIIANLETTPIDNLAEVVIQARAAEILPDIVQHVRNMI